MSDPSEHVLAMGAIRATLSTSQMSRRYFYAYILVGTKSTFIVKIIVIFLPILKRTPLL